MGQNNAFYLDEDVLLVPYKYLYAIAFNSSSKILIRSNKKAQNMSVFIIPSQNCDQHAFYGMSENHFQIEVTTNIVNYNIRACGFSPSFIANINQNITFGFSKDLNSNAQIFYGFNNNMPINSQANTLSQLDDKEYQSNDLDTIVQELDNYLQLKKLYSEINKKKKNACMQHKDAKRNNIVGFFGQRLKMSSRQIDKHHFLKKDEKEEIFLKNNYRRYNDAFKTNSNSNIPIQQKKNNIISKLLSNQSLTSTYSSPGFLVTVTIPSEIRSLNYVNTSFYVIYDVNRANVSAEFLLEREIISKQSIDQDHSMLSDQVDFLLYHDKKTMSFIYDNKWAKGDKFVDQESSYFWKMMKWFLALIIILFSILLVIIVVTIMNYTKKYRKCCFKNKNNTQEYNPEDYDLSNNYLSQIERRTRNRDNLDINSLNEFEIETICYSPNLDSQVTYDNYSKKKNRNNLAYNQNAHDSDGFSYEYDYESSNYEDDQINDSNSEENIQNSVGKRKRKAKIRRLKSNSRFTSSPYELDVGSCENINDVNFSIETPENNHNSKDHNSYDLDNNTDLAPNPYSLPSLTFDINIADNNDEAFKPPYPPIC